MRKHRGFTLVELVLVIIIMSIITAITTPLLQEGFNAYFTSQSLTDADWQSRIAFSRINKELRTIPFPASITTASPTQLVFTDANSNSVTYQLTGSSLMRNSNVLADGVNSLTFGYYDRNGATTATIANIRYISMTLNITQSSANLTIKTVIYPRNFWP